MNLRLLFQTAIRQAKQRPLLFGGVAVAAIALLAHREHLNLREAAVKSGHLTAEQFDQWVRPEKMARPHADA